MSGWSDLTGYVNDAGNVFGQLHDLMTSDAGEDPQTTMAGADQYQQKQLQATEVPQNVGESTSKTMSIGGVHVNPLYVFGGLLLVGGLVIAVKS